MSLVTRVSDGWSGPGLEEHWGLRQTQARALPAGAASGSSGQPSVFLCAQGCRAVSSPGQTSRAGGMPGPGLGLFLPVIQDRLEFLSRSSGLFSALCQIVKGDCVTSPGAVPAPEDGDTRPQRKSM